MGSSIFFLAQINNMLRNFFFKKKKKEKNKDADVFGMGVTIITSTC
jgi:hypothetical protein